MAGSSDLKSLIRTVADFPAPGIRFRDITTLLVHGQGLAQAMDALAQRAGAAPFVAVAGIEARGFIFGSALALRLGVGFIPLRKAGKLPVPTLAEEYALEYGEALLEIDPSIVPADGEVLLVDDLLATGGTALAGARLLRRAGARCERALFLIDLPDLGGAEALARQGLTAEAIISFPGH